MLLLFLTASALNHGYLRSAVVPRLQHQDVFDHDYVHDDTAHPAEAVKVNIQESENRLHEARRAYEASKAAAEAAQAAQASAAAEHAKHAEDLAHAAGMVAKFNESLAKLPDYEAAVAAAQEAEAAATAAVNSSDVAATAAAETVKQAQEDLHASIMTLVDAKDNASLASHNASHWEAKIEAALSANASLVEWQAKHNASAEKVAELRTKLDAASEALDAVHRDWKAKEARYDEAQKLFDIDRERYEEYVGPYPPEAKADENLWWDAAMNNDWHTDWER